MVTLVENGNPKAVVVIAPDLDSMDQSVEDLIGVIEKMSGARLRWLKMERPSTVVHKFISVIQASVSVYRKGKIVGQTCPSTVTDFLLSSTRGHPS